MKKSFLTLASLAVLAQGCATPSRFLSDIYYLKEEPQLVVNNQKGLVTKVHASEQEALSQLRRLVRESELEESWVYVPEEKEWWEVGRYSWVEGYQALSSLNQPLIEFLAGSYPEVIKYHIHPEKAIAHIFSQLEKDTKEKVSPDVKSVIAVLPSDSDLYSALFVTCSVSEFFPGHEVVFKVASPAGITEYTPDIGGIKTICAKEGNDRILAMQFGATYPRLLFDFQNGYVKLVQAQINGSSTVLYQDNLFKFVFTPYGGK